MKRPTCTFAMFLALSAIGLANVGSADDKEKSKNEAKLEKRLSTLEARVDGIEGHLKKIDGRLEKGHAELLAAIKKQPSGQDKGVEKKPTDKKLSEHKAPEKKPTDASRAIAQPDPGFQKVESTSKDKTDVSNRSSSEGSNSNSRARSGDSNVETTMTCRCNNSANSTQSRSQRSNSEASSTRSGATTTTTTRSYIYVPRSTLQNLRFESSGTRSSGSSILRSETVPCEVPVVDPCVTTDTTTEESRSFIRLGAPQSSFSTSFRSLPLATSQFAPLVSRSDFAPAPVAAPISNYVVTSLPWSTAHIRGANSIVTVPSQKRPYVLTPDEAAYWGVTESVSGAGSEPQRSFSRRTYYGPFVR